MAMYRVRTFWTGSPVSDGETSHYFDASAGTPGAAVSAVGAFWDDVKSFIDNSQLATVSGVVDLIDEATGDLVDSTGGPDFPVAGTSTATALPPATQLLMRLRTATVVGGRRLQGRFFVPGFTEDWNSDPGVVFPATADACTAAGGDLAAGGTHQLVVWHRPVDGAGGSKGDVISAEASAQWALLGRRRPGF